jgi:hypothetical protein
MKVVIVASENRGKIGRLELLLLVKKIEKA